ncbi:hypothetical protein B0A55_00896 [Friedmanniomyces simplex]|uniref:Uncharacterized protein n=1 Tax=Friedmanniomyces simplex TaxID=329884 RepID=A0A4U0XZ57_9PEZI|nr:hypothetical protein B0A55_00896 [Friedmanniomyces simplex]
MAELAGPEVAEHVSVTLPYTSALVELEAVTGAASDEGAGLTSVLSVVGTAFEEDDRVAEVVGLLLLGVLAILPLLTTDVDDLVTADLVVGFTTDVADALLELAGLTDVTTSFELVVGLADELFDILLVLVGFAEVTTALVLDVGLTAAEDEATGAAELDSTSDPDDAPPGPETLVVISPLSM